MEIWKSQKRRFPDSHRSGGYYGFSERRIKPQPRVKTVKYVPGLKCKVCPRLDILKLFAPLGAGCRNNFDFGSPAPKGAFDSECLTASLKRCPDTRPRFSVACLDTAGRDGGFTTDS
jgi:hypothetical protein